MKAYSVNTQPNPSNVATIVAAYRQIRYLVVSDSAPDPILPMYADVYIRNASSVMEFYKTITSYSINGTGGILSGLGLYQFDIQDICQEAIKTLIPSVPIIDELWVSQYPPYSQILAEVYFRGSSIVGGILVPEGPVPTEGTLTSPPISTYTGLTSYAIFINPASILPDYDNNIFSNSLENFLLQKRLGGFPGFVKPRIYPLSTLPLGYDGNGGAYPDPNTALQCFLPDTGGFPIDVIAFAPYSGMASLYYRNVKVILQYSVLQGAPAGTAGSGGRYEISNYIFMGPGVHYLPLGLYDIDAAGLLPAGFLTELLRPNNNYYYQIVLHDYDYSLGAGADCFYSPWFKPMVSATERTRVAFQNTFGVYEWLTFLRSSASLKVTSSEQLVPYFQPIEPIVDALSVGSRRNKITAQDTYTYTATFSEALLPWLKELMTSPSCFVQVETDNGPVLKPLNINDGTFTIRKSIMEGRINYVVSVQMNPAIEYITLRN